VLLSWIVGAIVVVIEKDRVTARRGFVTWNKDTQSV
jgi:hypothetical protein